MDNTQKNVTETDNTVAAAEKGAHLEITMEDFIKIIRDNKKLYCLSSMVVFVVSLIVFLFCLTPVYSVNASIETRTAQGSSSFSSFDVVNQFIGGSITSSKSIDFELLRSRTLMDSVIKKNNLQMNVKKKNNNMFSHYWSKILGKQQEDAFVVFRKIPELFKLGSGLIFATEEGYTIEYNGEKAECAWNSNCIFGKDEVLLEKVGTFNFPITYKFAYETIISTRQRVSNALNIDNVATSGSAGMKRGGNNEFITLSFTHESPLISVLVLDSFIDVYIEKKNIMEEEDRVLKHGYINKVLDELAMGIQEKEGKLIIFQQKEHTIMPTLEFSELLKKQETLKVQSEEFKFKRKILENSLDSIEKKPGKPITVPIDEPSVQDALKYHNLLLFKRNELAQRVTEEHPVKVAVDDEIKESENALKNVIKTSVSRYAQGEKIIDELLNMILGGKEKIPENLITFANLTRDVELAEKVYLSLSAKLYESSISPNIGVPPVRVIDAPDPFVVRSFPKSMMFLIVISIVTLISGFVIVFAKEFFKAAKEILK